ncbi:hypothetical protein [Salininema proteolyticum]|uniref:Uncharacterized protein n=1 Tax=Salininema proteolyticum TaxID=1607685 RepID=A0ABV8TZN3_9ACTN
MTPTEPRPTTNNRIRRWATQWPQWTGSVAVTVLSSYAIFAALWYFGGPYAFALPGNPENNFDQHWLAGLNPDTVQSATLLGGAVVITALLMMRLGLGGPLRPVLIAVGASSAAFLALVLSGPMSLDTIPVLNLLNLKRLDWVTVHIVVLTYVGLALGAATLAYARSSRQACIHCGRGSRPGWSRRRWSRIGTAAALAAALAPLGYAVSRICWALGIPLGTTKEHLELLNSNNPGNGTVYLELTLASLALCGGLLCFGLARPWSETWPRWVIGLAGKPVPHWLPIGSAVACGVGLTGYGAALSPALLTAVSGETVYYAGTDSALTWVSYLPVVSLTVWGPLVLLAAAAFHYRTRGRCSRCGRGAHPVGQKAVLSERPRAAALAARPAFPQTNGRQREPQSSSSEQFRIPATSRAIARRP